MEIGIKEIYRKGTHKYVDLYSLLFAEPIAVFIVYLLLKLDIKVNPNSITFFRIFFVIPLSYFSFLFFSYKLSLLFLGGILIIVNHILDNVDGILARCLSKTSLQGAFLDSIADRMGNMALLFFTGGLIIYYLNSKFSIFLFLLLIFFSIARFISLYVRRILLEYYPSLNIKISENKEKQKKEKKITLLGKKINILTSVHFHILILGINPIIFYFSVVEGLKSIYFASLLLVVLSLIIYIMRDLKIIIRHLELQ